MDMHNKTCVISSRYEYIINFKKSNWSLRRACSFNNNSANSRILYDIVGKHIIRILFPSVRGLNKSLLLSRRKKIKSFFFPPSPRQLRKENYFRCVVEKKKKHGVTVVIIRRGGFFSCIISSYERPVFVDRFSVLSGSDTGKKQQKKNNFLHYTLSSRRYYLSLLNTHMGYWIQFNLVKFKALYTVLV